MKQNSRQIYQKGFTLLELLTVISIMGVLASIFVVNFNAQRVPRDLTIARNETITNARKVQSYTLSSRDAAAGAINFYVLTFSNTLGQYVISSINSNRTYSLVETVNLPDGVRTELLSKDVAVDCAQVIFAAPFGKMYIRQFAAPNNITTDPNACIDSENLLTVTSDPIQLATLQASVLTVKLGDSRRVDLSNYFIKFYGLSGKIDIQ